MKTYLLKHEKWYHSNYAIYQDNEQVGFLLNESLKKRNTLGLSGVEFTIRRGNIWRNEQFIYQGNVQFAEIIQKTFKNETLLVLQNGDQYRIKQNLWKGLFTLYRGEQALGEYKGKTSTTWVTVSSDLTVALTAAFILTVTVQRYAYVAFAALIPIFIAVFSN